MDDVMRAFTLLLKSSKFSYLPLKKGDWETIPCGSSVVIVEGVQQTADPVPPKTFPKNIAKTLVLTFERKPYNHMIDDFSHEKSKRCAKIDSNFEMVFQDWHGRFSQWRVNNTPRFCWTTKNNQSKSDIFPEHFKRLHRCALRRKLVIKAQLLRHGLMIPQLVSFVFP